MRYGDRIIARAIEHPEGRDPSPLHEIAIYASAKAAVPARKRSPKMQTSYTTIGSVRLGCGRAHETTDAAVIRVDA
ncbi:MAG: hypothetical protein KGL39_37150 [Patescibacteria group bacterium]|nr:hypothetical protein [Patescibacteria group bacterium]